MKEEAAEPSSTDPAPIPGNPISSTTIKQPDDGASDDHDEEIEALLSDPKHESPRPSCKAKTPAPVEQPPKKRKGKKVAANTSKILKTRTEDQSDDNEENDEAVSRHNKRRKTDNDDANPERKDTNSNSLHGSAEGVDAGHTQTRPLIDSYRPSYEDNRILYGSDGSVTRLNSRHNTQYFQNAPQGPKIPEVLDTRQQPESGARTPYHGGRQTHPPRTPGRQNTELSPPQHAPQGPKNPHNQYNHSKQAGGARYRTWSPANRSSQNPGTKTPGWVQANRSYDDAGSKTPGWKNRTYEDAGSKTPGESQNHRPTSAPRGCTPGYFVDKEPSQSWKHGKSHFNSQQRRNENNQNPNNQQQPASKPTFTGRTHHRFKDEHDDRLFVSP